MAQFDRYVPYFHHNLLKMSIFLKLGVPDCSEVTLLKFGASQKAVFQPFFFGEIPRLDWFWPTEDPPSYTSLESYGSLRFNHIAQHTDHLTCQPSEFRWHSWRDFLDDPRLCQNHCWNVDTNATDTTQHYSMQLTACSAHKLFVCKSHFANFTRSSWHMLERDISWLNWHRKTGWIA